MFDARKDIPGVVGVVTGLRGEGPDDQEQIDDHTDKEDKYDRKNNETLCVLAIQDLPESRYNQTRTKGRQDIFFHGRRSL